MSFSARQRSLRAVRTGFAAFALTAAAVSAWPSLAATGGPFRPFLGSWQGSGRITSSNGQTEPISCRATYEGGDGGHSLSQALVCASDSFRLNIQSSVTAEDGEIRGQWTETTRNVQGDLSGQIGGGDFEGTVSGAGFTAQISLRSNGRRQVVHIAPSAGDIQSVDITLARRR